MYVTKHAIKRVKERTGLKKKLSEKLLTKALESGLQHKDVKGKLRKYVDWLFFEHCQTNHNIRIYNDYVFICSNDAFVTIFHIPKCHRSSARSQQKKMENI